MSDTPDRRFYRLREVADLLGVSKSFIRCAVRDGLLEAQQFEHARKVWLISGEALEDFLANHLRPVKPEQATDA